MKIYLVLICCFILACNSNGIEEVHLTVEDAKVISNDKIKDTVFTVEIDATLSFPNRVQDFILALSQSFDTLTEVKSILPERFSSVFNRKIAFHQVPQAENAFLYFFQYQDSLSFQNVISNWYGCFGDPCLTLEDGVGQPKTKLVPSLTLINEKQFEIIHFIFPCTNSTEEYSSVYSSLKKNFPAFNKSIRVDCNGNLKWPK